MVKGTNVQKKNETPWGDVIETTESTQRTPRWKGIDYHSRDSTRRLNLQEIRTLLFSSYDDLLKGIDRRSKYDFGNIDHTTVKDALRLSTRSEINVFPPTASSIEFIRDLGARQSAI
ncbi:hypothetical protein HZH66_011109 [Vespula vulgaris]|uniref:Uncharacterized protein n=1 Tax=Vespula vulgaris TaxID=7454 RepID=A0A834MV91_VESVU|nr:hypothetical protein HZH66_011109 [Vespula vulgaris]